MRKFGMISSTIWQSRRYKALASDASRLTYIYLHTTKYGNGLGCFSLPLVMIEHDTKIDDAEAAIADLVEKGLVRHDREEEVVQVAKFMRINSPSSRKNVLAPLQELQRLPFCDPSDWAAAEYMAAVWRQQRKWSSAIKMGNVRDTDVSNVQGAIAAFRQALADILLCRPAAINHIGDQNAMDITVNDAQPFIDDCMEIGVSIGLPLPFDIHKKPSPSPKPSPTLPPSPTPTPDTGGYSLNAGASDPPSPPADGGRSGRKPDDETQRTIDEMTKKAAKPQRRTRK